MHFCVSPLQWDGITDADSNAVEEESLLLTNDENREVDREEDAALSVHRALFEVWFIFGNFLLCLHGTSTYNKHKSLWIYQTLKAKSSKTTYIRYR